MNMKLTALAFVLALSTQNAFGKWNEILEIEAPNAKGWLKTNATVRTNALKIVKAGPGCKQTRVTWTPVYYVNGNPFYFQVTNAKKNENPPTQFLLNPAEQVGRIHIETAQTDGRKCTYTFYELTLDDDDDDLPPRLSPK